MAKHHTRTHTQHSSVFFLLSKLGTSIKKEKMKIEEESIHNQGRERRKRARPMHVVSQTQLALASLQLNRYKPGALETFPSLWPLHYSTLDCCLLPADSAERERRELQRTGTLAVCGQSYITKRQQLKPLPSV
jgi:hypothetical protein